MMWLKDPAHRRQLAQQAHEVFFPQTAVALAAGVCQVRSQIREPRRAVRLPRKQREHLAVHVHLQAACNAKRETLVPGVAPLKTGFKTPFHTRARVRVGVKLRLKPAPELAFMLRKSTQANH